MSYVKPAPGPISSRFGPRPSPGGIGSKLHAGTDIACNVGTAVVASAAGTVTFAGTRGGWGYLVIIDHGNGHETWYAHLSYIGVRYGQRVGRGQVIAASGGARGHPGAGTSTGPHLHTEHRVAGRAVDPEPFWVTVASLDGIDLQPITEEEKEEDEMNKPLLLEIENADGSHQWALVSADLARFVPIWKVDTSNALSKLYGTLILVASAEWNGFRAAAGLVEDPNVG